jgi:hypothetical protein
VDVCSPEDQKEPLFPTTRGPGLYCYNNTKLLKRLASSARWGFYPIKYRLFDNELNGRRFFNCGRLIWRYFSVEWGALQTGINGKARSEVEDLLLLTK